MWKQPCLQPVQTVEYGMISFFICFLTSGKSRFIHSVIHFSENDIIQGFVFLFKKHSAILLHKMSFRLHIINDVSIQPVPCFLLSFLQNMHAHLYHHSVPDETQLQAGCPVWQPQPFHLLQPVSLLFHKHRQYTVHG